nr:thioester domain-containing protein [Bacillus altitudinis]
MLVLLKKALLIFLSLTLFSLLFTIQRDDRPIDSNQTLGLSINEDGFLVMGGQSLYMKVSGDYEKAKFDKLLNDGDIGQTLLIEKEIEKKKKGLLSLAFDFISLKKADAAPPKITYLGKINYGGSVVGKFKVDGKIAFCFQHSKPTPGTGSKYDESVPYNNEKVQRALYYGWGGQENIFKDSEEDLGIVVTSLVLDRIYSNGGSGKNLKKYDELWDKVINGEVPDNRTTFSKRKLAVSVKGNKQVTESTTFKSHKSNSVNIKVPSNVTIINESTGKKITGGKMIVHGNERIRLEAGMGVGLNYSTGDLYGSKRERYQPLITKPVGGNTQVLGMMDVYRDPDDKTSFTAKFEVRQKKINVQHIDKYSGEVLEKESYTRNIGSTYSFSPKKSIAKGKEKFIPVNTNKKTGTLGSKDVTIKFYYNLERSVTVNYYDNRTGEKIKESKKYKKVRGEKYSEKHPSIKSGEYKYRYIRTDGDKESGTIGGKNIVINYHYDKPLAKLSFDKLQIYTAKSTKGLPVKVHLSKEMNYKTTLKDFEEKKITVGMYLKDKKIVSKTYSAKELPKKIEMTIPSDGLKAAVKNLYTVKFTGFNKNDFKIDAASTLSTDGYAASEKTIKATSEKQKEFSYKGVVMTEKTPSAGKVYYETLTFPLAKIEKKKTGYGFERKVNLHYENEIGGSIQPSFDFEVPTRLVDSYLTYKKSGDRSLITMEQTKAINKKQGETSVHDLVYELPHINVERHTGSLFSDEQVENKDKRIAHELVDGGRKFYSPIWAELGKYDTKIKSKPMGVNLVKTEVTEQLELYASMYAHMDSKTIDQDEVLLKPVYADNPFPNGLPEGWTKKDLDWVMSR